MFLWAVIWFLEAHHGSTLTCRSLGSQRSRGSSRLQSHRQTLFPHGGGRCFRQEFLPSKNLDRRIPPSICRRLRHRSDLLCDHVEPLLSDPPFATRCRRHLGQPGGRSALVDALSHPPLCRFQTPAANRGRDQLDRELPRQMSGDAQTLIQYQLVDATALSACRTAGKPLGKGAWTILPGSLRCDTFDR
jgi:hypothetical protein